MPLMPFVDAIADSEKFAKRHLLLGNGFSIACRADIFHYGSLFGQADFSKAPGVEAGFTALDTQDFESAIKSLETASTVLTVYADLAKYPRPTMLEHAKLLKEILVETIAANHPAVPGEIPDQRFWACR